MINLKPPGSIGVYRANGLLLGEDLLELPVVFDSVDSLLFWVASVALLTVLKTEVVQAKFEVENIGSLAGVHLEIVSTARDPRIRSWLLTSSTRWYFL